MAILSRDLEFSAEMKLKLITEFNNSQHPEDLNRFKEGENLEILSANMLSICLRKGFGVDVETLRHTLNKESFTQVELVTLAHHATEIANTVKQPEDHQARMRRATANDTAVKKQKSEEPPVSIVYTYFISFDIIIY